MAARSKPLIFPAAPTKHLFSFLWNLHVNCEVADDFHRANSLAYAELYLTLANLIRRFDFELFETTIEDVEPVCDAFMPMPKIDSKGVRVFVQGRNTKV